jgi:hypothetical protein
MKENKGDLITFMANMIKKEHKKKKEKASAKIEPPTPLYAYVDKFSQLGEMRMQFNQSLVPELFYINDIDKNLLEFTLVAGDYDPDNDDPGMEQKL